MSHYELNQDVNLTAGNTVPENTTAAVRYALAKQLGIIKQELWELRNLGIAVNNYKEIRDGVGDAIVVWDGFVHYASNYLTHPGQVEHEDQMPTVLAVTRAMDRLDELHAEATDMFEHDEFADAVVNGCQSSIERLQKLVVAAYENIATIATYYAVPIMPDQYAIYDSNMSKFDTDSLTAAEGIAEYQKQGVPVKIVDTQHKGVSYYIIRVAETVVVNGKEYVEGKFLKSVDFKKPDFVDTPETVRMGEYLAELGNPQEAQAARDAMATPAEAVGGVTEGLETQIADVKATGLSQDEREPGRDYYELKVHRANGETVSMKVNLPADVYDGDKALMNFNLVFNEIEQARLTQFMDPDKRAAITSLLGWASLMATIRNLNERRVISVELDPADTDPGATLAFLAENLNNTVEAPEQSVDDDVQIHLPDPLEEVQKILAVERSICAAIEPLLPADEYGTHLRYLLSLDPPDLGQYGRPEAVLVRQNLIDAFAAAVREGRYKPASAE